MKQLSTYIQEKLIINKDYRESKTVPKSFSELRRIIIDRYDKLGAGTKENPIDFNDIDVSNLDSFCNDKGKGIFDHTDFKYIDISYWDVSNVRTMSYMFAYCKELKSVGDISYWNVSNVTNMHCMFLDCKLFNQDLSSWNVSNVTDMAQMFRECRSFNQDISKWDVSKVSNMVYMFYGCASFNQDISKWNVYNVKHHDYMFEKCPIKRKYKPKFKK